MCCVTERLIKFLYFIEAHTFFQYTLYIYLLYEHLKNLFGLSWNYFLSHKGLINVKVNIINYNLNESSAKCIQLKAK